MIDIYKQTNRHTGREKKARDNYTQTKRDKEETYRHKDRD